MEVTNNHSSLLITRPLAEAALEWQVRRNQWKHRILDLALASGWLPHMTLNTEDRQYLEQQTDPAPLEVAQQRVAKAHDSLATAYQVLQEVKAFTGDTRSTRELVRAAHLSLQQVRQ